MLKNGKLYVDTSKTPNIGISIKEIARCIGVGSGDLGTLVSHKNNNMWSRKKPVVINTIDVNYNVPDWWRGAEGNCGVAAPNRVKTVLQVLAQYDGKLNGWTHILPHSNFRILDYNGYYHYAKPPITGIESLPVYFKRDSLPIEASISYNDNDIDETGSGSLQLSDIKIDDISLDNWYIGVAILNEAKDKVICRLAQDKGVNIETITIPSTFLTESFNYYLMPFYSKTSIDINEGDKGDWDLMSIPLIYPVKFKLESLSKLVSVGLQVFWNNNKTAITVIVTIKNNSYNKLDYTGDYSFGVIRLRFLENDYDDDMANGEYDIYITQDIGIIEPNETKVITKTQSIPVIKDEEGEVIEKEYKAWARVQLTTDIYTLAGPEEAVLEDEFGPQ